MELGHTVEIHRHQPHLALRGLVAGVVGMSERAPGEVRRSQPAGSLVPLVLSFGESLTIEALSDGVGSGRSYGSFVAGLSTGHASTVFRRRQDCIQVYLTPLGVRGLLGVPGKEVARRVKAVDDLVPGLAGSFADRLASTTSWSERFRLVEAVVLARSQDSGGPDWIARMCATIASSGGQAKIGELVAATGWSHRYVVRAFGEAVGIRPKELAGVTRFERALADLGKSSLTDVAATHGFADQSHLHRDAIRYAGRTPTQLATSRPATAHTALGTA